MLELLLFTGSLTKERRIQRIFFEVKKFRIFKLSETKNIFEYMKYYLYIAIVAKDRIFCVKNMNIGRI